MADVDKKNEEEQEGAEKKSKGFSPMLLIGIIGGMLVVGLIAFVIVFKVLSAPPKEEAVEEQGAQEEYFGKLFSFEEPLIVNLAESKGQRYLKVSIQFEVSSEEVIEELKVRTPQMLDLLITVLSSKTIDEVANTVGRNRLRREVIDKSNAELLSGKIVNVYFTEFVIQ